MVRKARNGRLTFLPLLVLTHRGAAPVKTNTGNNFPPKNTREFSDIMTNTAPRQDFYAAPPLLYPPSPPQDIFRDGRVGMYKCGPLRSWSFQ